MSNKEEFMKNYTSLMNKTNNNDIKNVLEFCNYFKCDDLNLFNEYKAFVDKGIKVTDLIVLYGKRYNLNPVRDEKEIMKLFVKNTIQDGFSYHLGNSVNNESIMKKGFGINSLGLKTEEDKDYELLKSSLDEEVFHNLEPFYKTKVSGKTFFSNVPILDARYGDRPEWLIELKNNYDNIKNELNEENNILVSGIIDKYDRKYNNTSKRLYLIKNPLQISDDKIESLSKVMSASDVINYLYSNVLNQKDLSTDSYIPSDDIMSIDLNTYKISYSKDGEIIEYNDGSQVITNNM